MALSVVFYHFSMMFNMWGSMDSGTLLGRLGIYAVSAFYVISGMAMYLAHKNSIWTPLGYVTFMVKRFLRLAPVYWIALFAITIVSFLFSKNFSFNINVFLQNIFLIFGITNPANYLVMGGWSIGNEVVFYLLFPLFILFTRNKHLMLIIFLSASILLWYCSMHYLSPDKDFELQWGSYINPLNQVFFFIFGVVLAKLLLPHVGKYKLFVIVLTVVLFFAFLLHQASGGLINIVTGWNKIYFTSVIVLLCACFFMIGDLVSIKPLHVALKFLGDISYPLYLLHGVTFICLKGFLSSRNIPADTMLLIGVAVILLLFLASWICHILIEIPIISFSKKITSVKKVKVNGIASG
ncbi:TPA: acyltransferase [Escherichia coli]|nr:acyltransferase [Escherichia coli]HAW2880432.1 acyltransferase [Escherichia coli]